MPHMRIFLLFIMIGTVISVKGQSFAPQVPADGDVLFAEKKLAEIGFWIRNIDSVVDESTRYAVLAFQRAEGIEETGALTLKELLLLKKAKIIVPRSVDFPHFEVDLKRQIIFFVNQNGRVNRILPISSGTGKKFTEGGRTRRAVTPKGTFAVFRKEEDWKTSPLGSMYFPSYIVGGVAIHGSNFFPNRPSTYGCIKVPIIYAIEISRLMALGTTVMIY